MDVKPKSFIHVEKRGVYNVIVIGRVAVPIVVPLGIYATAMLGSMVLALWALGTGVESFAYPFYAMGIGSLIVLGLVIIVSIISYWVDVIRYVNRKGEDR